MRVLGIPASIFSVMVLMFLSISCGSNVSPSASVDRSIEENTALPETGLPEEQVLRMTASWAMGYSSIGDLAGAADVIALGSMGGIPQTADINVNSQDQGIPLSGYSFEVEQVLKGPISAGSFITIVQTGGKIGATVFEFTDDPLFIAGQAYLLFLRRVADGSFGVLGGPAGRFVVTDDLVSSLSSVYPNRNISDLSIDQADLTTFSDEVRTTLAEQQ